MSDEAKEKLLAKISHIEVDIKKLEDARKAAWDEIKDFTVSAEKADAGYRRMKNMLSEINTLRGEITKLRKKLLKEERPAWSK